MGKTYFVIMSNKSRRLYVGITSEFQARVFQHKNKWYEGSFTARYRFDMLVYFEAFSNPSEAIDREKEIKGWRREKRLRLILAANPDWADMTTPARKNRACRGPRLSAEWRKLSLGRLFRKRSSTRCCAGSHAKAESRGSRFLRTTGALMITPARENRACRGPRLKARAPYARSE